MQRRTFAARVAGTVPLRRFRLASLALLVSLLLPLSLHAQITFQRTSGGMYGDHGFTSVQTTDCG